VDEVIEVAFAHARPVARADAVEIRRERGVVRRRVADQPRERGGQIAARDRPDRQRLLGGERGGEEEQGDGSQNSSLIPSWPYRGKFDCRVTVRSIEPNSALAGLFS